MQAIRFVAIAASLSLCAVASIGSHAAPMESRRTPKLDLNASAAELREAFSKVGLTDAMLGASVDGGAERVLGPLDEVIATGIRNLAYLTKVNEGRAPDAKISLTSAESTISYPIEKAKIYNDKMVVAGYRALLENMPAELKSVLLGTGDLPSDLVVSENQYVESARELNRAYDTAVRWRMMTANGTAWLEFDKAFDVRGYYFLQRESDLADKLNGYSKLPAAKQVKLKDWLAQECLNDILAKTKGVNPEKSARAKCEKELARALSSGKTLAFHEKHLPGAKENWDSYFTVATKRTDVRWNAAERAEAFVPFTRPGNTEVEDFLRDNVEDEWKTADWNLRLTFEDLAGPDTARVKFEPGTVPHVDGVGGNVITMDENKPLTEYGVRWTIRHEFGHVLGFPDCYFEFYDRGLKAIVSYQLDVSNLMCSRRGHFDARMFEEMKRAYLK